MDRAPVTFVTPRNLAIAAVAVLAAPAGAAAQAAAPPPAINQADTAWMLVATALVLLMTPALAFFYGGLVRSKNALNTMMMSFVALGFVGVFWALLGYTLAFSRSCAALVSNRRARFRTSCSWPIRARSASLRRR
jgi:hypothetical protein